MAGTDDDNITSADWRLASIELAFVTEYTHSESAAKELLLGFLDDGSIRWRCFELAIEDSDPLLVTSIAAARRFFWRRASHSLIDMGWAHSGAIRVGPVMKLGRPPEDCDVDREASNNATRVWPIWPIMKIDEHLKGDTWPNFDLRGSTSIKASLIRFHHPDVVAMLQFVGLVPRPPAPSPPSPPSSQESMPIVEAASAVSPSPPEQESAPVTPTKGPREEKPGEVTEAAPAALSLSTKQTSESPESPIPRLLEMRRAGLLRGIRQKMAANWARDAYPP